MTDQEDIAVIRQRLQVCLQREEGGREGGGELLVL